MAWLGFGVVDLGDDMEDVGVYISSIISITMLWACWNGKASIGFRGFVLLLNVI